MPVLRLDNLSQGHALPAVHVGPEGRTRLTPSVARSSMAVPELFQLGVLDSLGHLFCNRVRKRSNGSGAL
jgi:hypothetical protein